MDFKTRVATMEDLDRLCEVEVSAMPGSPPYLRDNADYFFNQAPGIIFCAENENEEIVGMGRYSRQPDNSGWLETLRVHEDWQNMGVGKLIYKDYFDYAQSEGADTVRMYTEAYNIRSKTLAESLGFILSRTYGNKKVSLDKDFVENNDFKLVNSFDEVDFDNIKSSWGKYISLNRTFFKINEENFRWMIDEKMVYTYENSVLVLGARMLKERGLFLSLAVGDLKSCVEFAMTESKRQGYDSLTTIYPIEYSRYEEVLDELGFEGIYNLLVMEKTL